MFKIVKREEMASGTVVLNEIEAPRIAAKARPGQFLILKANENGERIPLTMAETDPEKGTVTVIYMVVGKSTELFRRLQVGDAYQDVIGPLGQPTHIEPGKNVVCVGGGTGVAVLHPIARGMKNAGCRVTSIIGARNRDLLILEDKMRLASTDLHICTDDGSYGRKGFVTEVLKEQLTRWRRRSGRGHRPGADDEVRVAADQRLRRADHGQPQPHHDRRNGHVRRVPGHGRGRNEVRLRGRAGIRRTQGGF